jgi:DNA polymerase eta
MTFSGIDRAEGKFFVLLHISSILIFGRLSQGEASGHKEYAGLQKPAAAHRQGIARTSLDTGPGCGTCVAAQRGQRRCTSTLAEIYRPSRTARYELGILYLFFAINGGLGYDAFRSKQVPFPFVREITVDIIAAFGDKLWKELVGIDASRSIPMKITNVQLSFSGIESMEIGQRRIEGFFQKPSSSGQDPASYGQHDDSSSCSGNSCTTLKRKRSGSSPEVTKDGDVVKQVGTGSPAGSVSTMTPGFVCDRCGKQIVPQYTNTDRNCQESASAVFLDDMREELTRLRREHDDFHFAQDLANQVPEDDRSVGRAVIRPSENSVQANKKRKQDGKGKTKNKEVLKGGIAKFFTQR